MLMNVSLEFAFLRWYLRSL